MITSRTCALSIVSLKPRQPATSSFVGCLSTTTPREHLELARELTRTVDRDARLIGALALHDFHFPCRHDEKTGRGLAPLEQHVARSDRARPAVRGDARHLRGGQRRKHQLAPP